MQSDCGAGSHEGTRRAGEPLYQDVSRRFIEAHDEWLGACKSLPRVIGGRYGLSSKEFTPAMVKAVFDNLAD